MKVIRSLLRDRAGTERLAVLGKEWVWVDSKEIPLPGVTLPEGQRAVTGLQRMVAKEQLDRNSKMQVLIRAARKTGIVDETMAADLDELRKTRNRIHIKTLEGPECTYYTARMANDALDLLERSVRRRSGGRSIIAPRTPPP